MRQLRTLRRAAAQRGDTIVEVMIVLAVLGLAISISYATANRSLLDTRQAQENSQATELVQSQIEALRLLAPTPPTDPNYASKNIFAFPVSTNPDGFCITSTNAGVAADYSTAAYSADTNSAYAQNCTNQQGLYQLQIIYTPADSGSPQNGGTFEVVATWPDVEGEGNDTVTIFYNLYPPASLIPPGPPSPKPTVNLSDSLNPGGTSYTLTWNSTNATSCIASGGWSYTGLDTSGDKSVSVPTEATTYDLTCTGSGGSGSNSVEIDPTPSLSVSVTGPPSCGFVDLYGFSVAGYSASIAVDGPAGDTVDIVAGNNSPPLLPLTHTFTIGSDGTVSGRIAGFPLTDSPTYDVTVTDTTTNQTASAQLCP